MSEDVGASPPGRIGQTYLEALDGMVAMPGMMQCSLAEFGRRIAICLKDEQEKISPDNALIALLCDAAWLGWECIQLWEENRKTVHNAEQARDHSDPNR